MAQASGSGGLLSIRRALERWARFHWQDCCAKAGRLEQITTPVDAIQVGGCINNRGKDLSQPATKKGLEGIVAFADKPAVENSPKIPEKIQWVQSKPVGEVAYAGWTEDEQVRRIQAPRFCCSILLENSTVTKCPPVIDYLKGWRLSRVALYCQLQKWRIS